MTAAFSVISSAGRTFIKPMHPFNRVPGNFLIIRLIGKINGRVASQPLEAIKKVHKRAYEKRAPAKVTGGSNNTKDTIFPWSHHPNTSGNLLLAGGLGVSLTSLKPAGDGWGMILHEQLHVKGRATLWRVCLL